MTLMTKRFNTLWYIGCSEQEKKARKELVDNSIRIREVLEKILRKKLEDNSRPSPSSKMTVNWPLQKAHQEGYNRAIFDLLTIVTNEKDKDG